MPKYKEIALALKERIVEGKYQEGSKLPEQESLAREFKTSCVTIRKAIQLLLMKVCYIRDVDLVLLYEAISDRTMRMSLK